MPSAYCTAADLYKAGLPRGALPNPGRLVAAVATGTEIMTLDGHGFADGDELLFRAESGGSLPSPLVAGTTYYAVPLTDATFQVAATPGGSPINLTSSGSNIIVSTPLPIAEAIEYASGLVDDFLVGHGVPLSAPYPITVVSATADLAIARLCESTGGASLEFIEAKKASGQKHLERWAKGIPLRGAIVPPSANLAVVSSAAGTDPRGWLPEEGTLP